MDTPLSFIINDRFTSIVTRFRYSSPASEGLLLMEDFEIPELPEFPKRITEKLKTIREHFNMTADEFAPLVHAKNGAEIESYERDLGSDVEDGLLVTTLWRYARVARVSMEDLIDDDRELIFSPRNESPFSGGNGHAL